MKAGLPEVSPGPLPEAPPRPEEVPLEDEAPPPGGEPEPARTTEALGKVSVAELMRDQQINPETALELARGKVDQAFHVAERRGRFMPAVASAIAHYHEESPEIIYPTAEEIKEESFMAGLVSDFLGFFSSSWADSFDRYLERGARQRVSHVARRATTVIDTIGGVDAPKAQFLKEVTSMQGALSGGESPQDKLPELAKEVSKSRPSADDKKEETDQDNQYSFLGDLIGLSGFGYQLAGRKRTLRAFTPEIMQGVERFLKQQGVEVQQPVQTTDYNSLTRRIVKRFAPRKVSNIPARVEALLTSIYDILPEDGRRFKNDIYELSKHIEERSRHGQDGRDLTQELLAEIRESLE